MLLCMANQESQTFHGHYTEFDDNTLQIRGRTVFFVVVLFCVILFSTLIYLFGRCVCRIRPPSSSVVPPLAHAPLPESMQPQGLDPNAISKLPIILHRASMNSNEVECSICLGIFQDDEKVKVLPHCQHRYHSGCVDVWLRTQSSCPLCRASLRLDSPV